MCVIKIVHFFWIKHWDKIYIDRGNFYSTRKKWFQLFEKMYYESKNLNRRESGMEISTLWLWNFHSSSWN